MKNKLLVLLIGLSIILVACSPANKTLQTNSDELEEEKEKFIIALQEKEIEIHQLNQENEQLKLKLKELNDGLDLFPIISNLSREFVQAHTSGDREKVSQLLSDELVLQEQDNKLYVIVDNYEWLLFSEGKEKTLSDWVIQGFSYNQNDQTVNVFIREFLVDANGEPDAPPTFLGLTYKKIADEWKIISLGFDV